MLRDEALVVGRTTLASGREADYYVDCRRALLTPKGFRATGELVTEVAAQMGAVSVGGPTLGADPIACSVLSASDSLKAFIVRTAKKDHGMQRWIEGPPVEPGERALIVEDVVTSGGSLVKAIERVREEGIEVAGVMVVLDRLAGGREPVEAALGDGVPYVSLFTIDDVYPDRPDR